MPIPSFFGKGGDAKETSDVQDRPFPSEDSREKNLDEEQNNDLNSSDGESLSSGQDGVKMAQATTIVWTRKSLIIAYGL